MQKVDFATIISKAFEHAANEDAKTFQQLQASSSCSSSTSANATGGQSQSKAQVHLVPNNWMASFQTYMETKVEIHNPGSIENKVLLKQSFLDLHNNDSLHHVVLRPLSPETTAGAGAASKCRPTSPTSTSPSLSCTSSASSASEMALADDNDDDDDDQHQDHDDQKKQNRDEEGDATAVIIGCSPSSSTTTNHSYVLVNTDAQSFVKNETTTALTAAASTKTKPVLTNQSEQESGETSTSMDDRTKRRLKWASKKEEQQQQDQGQVRSQKEKKIQSSNESASSSLTSSLSSSSSSTNKNVLKKAILHEIDYYVLGHNTWTLLSSKFGFDIDIQSHVVVNESMSNSMSGGWGRLCVVGLRDVLVPEDGLFDYAKNFVSSGSNNENDYDRGNVGGSLNGGNVAGIAYNIHGGGGVDGDDDNDSTKNNQEVDDLDDDDLYNDDDDEEENNQVSSSSPILLLPPSTTSYTSNIDHTTSASAMSVSSSSSLNNINNNNNAKNNSNPRKRKRYGLGLGNLGNTCFMNSTLQCLAHTSPLRSYFLSGEFAHDLNRDNPLGTGGELAQEFANLLAEMWGTNQQQDVNNNYLSCTSSSSTSRQSSYRRSWASSSSSNVVYPRNFKYTLGKHAEQFMGYNQHDSQELATYLLDALHEDTNRVSKKPYVEKPEQREGESDDDAAKRAWELHLKREDSRVMENFMGQVKSRVECPIQGCGRVSTTFDPFMYLSVPLPGATERTIEVDFVLLAKNICVKRIKVTLSKNANCAELKKKAIATINELVFKESGEQILAENIVMAENFHRDLYQYYEPDDEVAKIRDGDHVVAYEVASVQSIREEIDKQKEKDLARADQGEESSKDEPIDDRPNGRLKLDVATLTSLNSDQEWETTLNTYMCQPTFFAALMNPKRKRLEDRKEFQNRLTKFINRCYASPECNEVLHGGRITPTSDVEIDSCDGNDSEDGKMSPTSTVATQLKATAVDDKAVPTLEELCFSSKIFKNVRTPKDVATIEFCSKKFRQYIKNEEEKKQLEYADGAEIQIVFKKGQQFSNPQPFANPLLLRISPSLTVYQLRQVLADRLSHVLRNPGKKDSPIDEVVKEEKVEHDNSMNDEMDCTEDHDKICFPDCSDAMKVMCQVPMTYERGGTSYYKYSSKSSYRKLGSVPTPGDTPTVSQVSTFAKPNEADEKELVLDHVGRQGKVNLCLLTSQLQQMLDVDELTRVETVSDPNDEDNTSGVTSVVDCISKYCQIEQLEETEMWYCNRCKDHVRAWKQFHLYRTPPILIVHLKRFHYSALTHRRDKIDSFIDFPLEGLDLRNEVMFSDDGEEPIYDCYAVSNHFGGLGGGHYTAYALNDDGEWCNFDDSRVTTNVEKSEVVSKSAYVLYYKRRDVKTDDELWTNRALPAVCSRESSPVTTNMEIEGGDSDNIYSMEENDEDDDYGIKQFESISARTP